MILIKKYITLWIDGYFKGIKKNSRIDCSLIFVYSDWVSQILADKQIKKAPNLINKGFRAFKITFVCYIFSFLISTTNY